MGRKYKSNRLCVSVCCDDSLAPLIAHVMSMNKRRLQVIFETRLDSIDGLIRNGLHKNAVEIDATNATIAANYSSAQDAQNNFREAIELCSNIFEDHALRLEARMAHLEEFEDVLGELADMQAESSARSIRTETRMEYIENVFGEIEDKHVKAIEGLMNMMHGSHVSLEDAVRL